MIFSDRQYAVSKAQLDKLREAAERAKADAGKHPRLLEIELNAFKSQIADIERDLAEYDLLKSGAYTFAESFSLSDLPRVLIQARIARGLSQTDLAQLLNMKPQQIQRYEATEYSSASLARLIEVAGVLDVKVSQSFVTDDSAADSAIFAWRGAQDVDFTRFPLKEMVKRGWFKATGSNLAAAAREYFLRSAGPQFVTTYHRKKVRGENAPNEHALLAWQARILELAQNALGRHAGGEFELNDRWLSELVGLTRDTRGPARARELLADNGIVLVIERHLTGTYLDGAAMLSAAGYPVIGLTLRYDRLDNFWFVLLHEIGHVFLHLFGNLKLDFFDEEDSSEADEIERQADRFALDRLIPDAAWKQCMSRFALSAEAVRIDAENLGIDPSIIAGRIRRERNNYMILNELIGANTVRKQMEDSAS
jgi:HTH-type transcriptional regulator / antitoxin HigA